MSSSSAREFLSSDAEWVSGYVLSQQAVSDIAVVSVIKSRRRRRGGHKFIKLSLLHSTLYTFDTLVIVL